jgi:hypothetical protein
MIIYINRVNSLFRGEFTRYDPALPSLLKIQTNSAIHAHPLCQSDIRATGTTMAGSGIQK